MRLIRSLFLEVKKWIRKMPSNSKIRRLLRFSARFIPFSIAFIPILLIFITLRLIRSFIFIRVGFVLSEALGHLAIEPELALCERDLQSSTYPLQIIVLCYRAVIKNATDKKNLISNRYLDKMWRRTDSIIILPAVLTTPMLSLLVSYPMHIPVLKQLVLRREHCFFHSFRDTKNLLDDCPPHLTFTTAEEEKGQAFLRSLGIPADANFVCLIVRDSSYYTNRFTKTNWNTHSFRDCDIDNFILVAEELAERGYYVIRMGSNVQKPLKISHSNVIDYATSGMRSEFLDIYLGAKCAFCISTGTGYDEIPHIFRRPIVCTNFVSIGRMNTYSDKYLNITKTHWCCRQNRRLSLREIFSTGLGFCDPDTSHLYGSKEVKLIENSPEQIRDATLEMLKRIEGTWQTQPEDEALQQKFWSIFPINALDPTTGEKLHGEIRSRFGTDFLRQDPEWLD